MQVNHNLMFHFSRLLLVTFLFVSSRASAVSLIDPAVFDWSFYCFSNSDLVASGITTKTKAEWHWQYYGVKEGRRSKADFAVRDYLALNADLTAAYGQNYSAAIGHYLQRGRYEGRKTIRVNSLYQMKIGSDLFVGNEVVRLKSSGVYGGAISGMNLRGREIANDHDSGRLIQTALSFDGRGECDNPTEGGASGQIGTSSSILLSRSISNGTISTRVQAANWLKSGQSSPFCAGGPATVPAVSNTYLDKAITVGYGGDPQVIEWKVAATIQNPHTIMNFEGLTGYHNASLNTFYQLDLRTSQLVPMKAIQLENPDWSLGGRYFPIILSTADGSSAIGVVAEDLAEYKTLAGTFQFRDRIVPTGAGITYLSPASQTDKTTKWSWNYSVNGVAPGIYSTRFLLAVGNLNEVQARLLNIVNGPSRMQFVPLMITAGGKSPFLADYYATTNPDLLSVFGLDFNKLLNHFLTYGVREGRVASPEFNLGIYRQYNPDVENYFGVGNTTWILWHWLAGGIAENRKAK